MTHPRTPGRRLALGALVIAGLGAGPACAVAAAPAASAVNAVTATVFPGTAGPVAQRAVPLAALEGCPAYTGPGELTLQPGGSFTLSAGYTWTLSEVLSCGLEIPSSDVAAVQVLRPDGAPERALSAAQLTDPGDYDDPAAPGALPVISNDGGQDQNTYTRPWRGGADENGADQVTDAEPIAIDVYENVPPLIVHARARPVSRGAHRERVTLSATVLSADHAPLATAGLRWHWSVSTGASSSRAAPTATIPEGSATITVQVSDPATGTGGTASITVDYKPATSRTTTTPGGGGTSTHGGPAGRRSSTTSTTQSSTTPTTRTTTSSTTTTTMTTTSEPTGTAPGSGAPASSGPATSSTPTSTTSTITTTSRPSPRGHHRPRPVTHARGRLVRGRLIGAVTPVSAAASPLTRPASAPPGGAAVARPAAAGGFTLPSGILAGALALGLFWLGAVRELWWRTPPRGGDGEGDEPTV